MWMVSVSGSGEDMFSDMLLPVFLKLLTVLCLQGILVSVFSCMRLLW